MPTWPGKRLAGAPSGARRNWLVLLALPPWLLLSACDNLPSDSPMEAVQRRLVGTWLREYEEQGTRVRRILVLQEQGSFEEMSTITGTTAGTPGESRATGEWLFDGTNLKRRYRTINGKPLSAPTVPFATFELRFPSKFEFVGVDHVRRLEVHYTRVPDGTLP